MTRQEMENLQSGDLYVHPVNDLRQDLRRRTMSGSFARDHRPSATSVRRSGGGSGGTDV